MDAPSVAHTVDTGFKLQRVQLNRSGRERRTGGAVYQYGTKSKLNNNEKTTTH